MTDPLMPPPMELLVITADECRELIDIAELRAALATAFQAHSDGTASVPPRIAAHSEAGLLGAMPGVIPGMGMATKLVSVFPGNHGGPIPSHQALIALFDEHDGRPLALLDGTYITAIRTGGGAAVAADLAARSDAACLAIIGAGVQGHAAARTFADIRPWSEIRVASRNSDSAAALADVIADATVADTFEAAVRGADVVALCTDAHDPIIDHAWLSPGMHVSSVGIGREIDAATMQAADRVLVEWRDAANFGPPAGAFELQDLDADALIEVGDVVAGRAEARTGDHELTVYKSTGHAVEDIAAARLVLDRAQAAGVGTTIRI